MNYSFKYGKGKVDLKLPDQTEIIELFSPESKIDRSDFISDLGRLIHKSSVSIGIVVSDKTRLCGYDIYLPWLVEGLLNLGIKSSDLKFYIAYGTHPRQTDEESLQTYGDTYNNYEFVHHDCDDESVMTLVGRTSRGTDIKVRKDILEHDQLVLFGAISHHYFAGYGGGRKLIFPGLAARDSIYSNHKLFIDFNNYKLHPSCQSGVLAGNPVAEDLLEIDKYFSDKVLLCGILNSSAAVSRILAGDSYSDFLEACKLYDKFYRKDPDIKYDNIIASAGGYPKDINFIQTHKSVHNAASFVKDGGKLFLLGECIDGIGNNSFLQIFSGDKKKIVDELAVNYSGNGGTALAMIAKTDRISVNMLTDLQEDACSKLSVNKLDISTLQNQPNNLNGSSAIIDNASIIFS